jgi:hypothetical protein
MKDLAEKFAAYIGFAIRVPNTGEFRRSCCVSMGLRPAPHHAETRNAQIQPTHKKKAILSLYLSLNSVFRLGGIFFLA